MIAISKAIGEGTLQLISKGIATPKLDAEILLAHTLKIQREMLFIKLNDKICEEDYTSFMDLIEVRKTQKPIARILGSKEFWSLNFKLGPATLIPRPDSETLVEETLNFIYKKSIKEGTILDLGTGTGCLLLSLLSECPNLKGVGIDKSIDAVKIAVDNANNLHLKERVKFMEGSWEDGLPVGCNEFDIIISNPPYITTSDMKDLMDEVKNFDPSLALEGGQDGLDHYKIIIPKAFECLKVGGGLLFEIGVGQEKSVSNLLKEAGFNNIEQKKDLAGKIRVVEGQK